MELNVCNKVCKECPFRKKSLQGWLGSHTVDEILNSQQFEGLFSCHMQRGDDVKENERKILSGEQDICRGYILSASLSCKLFGQNPNTGAELLRLQRENPLTDQNREDLMDRWDFDKHHRKYEINKKSD